MNILSIIYCLEQTAQERNLTVLYVCLFLLAMGMLLLDAFAMKKWTPKAVKGFLCFLFIASLAGVIFLLVWASRN